jgi:hypothetical protein
LIWAITGFNIVEGGVPLIGLQWSTFATFAFFFYVMMVNFQVGGLESPNQLINELIYDIGFLKKAFRHPLTARQHYLGQYAVHPFRAIVISVLACVSALFLFESVWVPLYDFLQFGSLMWPVYYAVTSFPPVIFRNVFMFVAPLFMVKLAFEVSAKAPLRWRVDFGFAWLLVLAASFWLAWVAIPHEVFPISSLNTLNIIGPESASFNPLACYVFPAQHFFPQNTYTFYPCSLKGMTYNPPQILGFFDSDPWVHLINVLTKVATFAAVCYPAMGIVKRAK